MLRCLHALHPKPAVALQRLAVARSCEAREGLAAGRAGLEPQRVAGVCLLAEASSDGMLLAGQSSVLHLLEKFPANYIFATSQQ